MTESKLLPGFTQQFADVKDVRLRYFVGGPDGAAPIVLVHGLGGAASNWTMVAPELARTRRVVIPELPGHGGSSPLPAAPSIEPYADRLGLLLERLGLLPAALVGHSLGGLVSLRLAMRRPDDVERIVLCAAAGITSSTRAAERVLSIVGSLQPGRRLPFRTVIARTPLLRRVVFSWWAVHDPEALEPRAAEGLLAGPALHTDTDSAWRALVRDDPRRDLERVRCACLLLWGANDNQLPLEDAFDYARRLRAPLRVVPRCGHLLIAERPDAVLDAIEACATL